MHMDIAPKLVVSVAGNWPDKHALAKDLAAVDASYQLQAEQLTGDRLQGRWELEFEEEDPFLQVELGTRIAIAEQQALGDHTRMVSLITDGGSEEAVRQVTSVAGDLLRAGGLAVNIPFSGKTFGRQEWFDLMEASTLEVLHEAYVDVIDIEADNSVVSCGMRNFGLPDGKVPDSLHLHEGQAIALLQAFTLHLLKDRPMMWGDDTFSTTSPSRTYQLRQMPCTQFEEDDALFNPYGYWVFSSR
jgi:hypothetical protein